jgi:hypothetical protein
VIRNSPVAVLPDIAGKVTIDGRVEADGDSWEWLMGRPRGVTAAVVRLMRL